MTFEWDNDAACENCCRLVCPGAGGDINACQMLQHREGGRLVQMVTAVNHDTGEVTIATFEVGGGIGETVATASLGARPT